LINGGVENPVSVMLDGTRGWAVAGGDLERGATRRAPPPSDGSLTEFAEIRRRIAEPFQVPLISDSEVKRRREGTGDRTFLLIDVRSREEYEAGHLAASIWIAGGDLIGMTQDHMATRNADLCLVDDGKGRAEIVASWLIQQGWPNVSVLEGGTGQGPLVSGPSESAAVTQILPKAPTMAAATLAERIETGDVAVVDFASSLEHRSGHVSGAWWMTRSSLPRQVACLPRAACYVTTSADGRIDRLAAAELALLVRAPVMALDGGTAAWHAAGHDLATGMSRPLGEEDDVYRDFAETPDDDPETLMAKRRRIIAWRTRLEDHTERDVTAPFVEPPFLKMQTN
jgi:rhodanese-related sulfurtransferase